MPPSIENDSKTSPPPAKGGSASHASAWRQFVLNLKVWAPFFSNRIDRQRLVRYSSADERVGLKWTVAMPRQCWACGTEESLAPREFKRKVKAYESPLPILIGTASAMGLALLILLFSPGIIPLLFVLAAAGIGLGLLKLKSWEEDVRLTVWSCPEHAGELEEPDMVLDDQQLCVFSPGLELADAAREAIRAKRKRGLRSFDEAAGPVDDDAPSRRRRPHEPPDAPMPQESPKVEELPPIKLAGEE